MLSSAFKNCYSFSFFTDMLKYSVLVCIVTICLSSCAKKKELPEGLPIVPKENAVELLLHTKTLPDGKVVFQLEKNIFELGSQKQHIIVSSDTLASLGTERVSVVNDDDDESSHEETTAKQYDVLFKVDTLK